MKIMQIGLKICKYNLHLQALDVGIIMFLQLFWFKFELLRVHPC